MSELHVKPIFVATACLLSLCSAGTRELRAADAAGIELFEKRIRPLLAEHCYQCHGAEKQESGLALHTVSSLTKGGDRGPAIVPGDPDESLIVVALRYTDDDLKMPPRGRLSDEQIAVVVEWIKMGAAAPKEDAPATISVRPDSEFNLEERRQHWAYQPVARPNVPRIQNSECRMQNAVDSFWAARLMEHGLFPASEADRRTLIRRVTFDLTGLPPTPNEVAAFLADESPDAYERLVDRLLASPRYGERWARHWLDVVRYSETLGFEFDYDLHNAWRYRDYVIRAMNADLPYDQFVIEHLAGDLVEQPRRHPIDGCNESILATGMWWMLEGKQTPVDIRQDQCDRIDNQLDVLGKAFLGQTIACARCHDHKFDAIATRDYYALAGYLKSSRYQQAFLDPPETRRETIKQLDAMRREIERRFAGELLPLWRKAMKDAGRYLRAAADASGKDEADVTALAETAGLDSRRLQQWIKALEHQSLSEADHPLYAWKKLTSEKQPEAISDADAHALLEELGRQALSVKEPLEQFPLTDWFATGDAAALQATVIGQAVIGEGPRRPIARFTSAGIDSGLISLRVQGELRSPSFTIDKKHVHVRVAGHDARVNLVIDGYTLIMNPMYGKLTVAPASNVFTWRTMPVDRWMGRRAYFEVSDSTIPMYGLNPPPSAAREPRGPEGYLAVEKIVFSDEPQPPVVPSLINQAVLVGAAARHGQSGPRTASAVEALAEEYDEVFSALLDHWFPDYSRRSQNSREYVPLVNWLLESGLLDAEEPAGSLAADGNGLAGLTARYHEVEQSLPAPQRAPALADGTGEDEHVLLRGNWRTPGERAPRGLPQVLHTSSLMPQASSLTSSGRLELAQRLVDRSNPLLPRVLVNRLWQHHFGAGIVRTPDDFGRMGQPPTHPDLLDYLASELIDSGWSIKTLQRRLVTASVYRQGSGFRVQGSEEGAGFRVEGSVRGDLPDLNPEPRTLNPSREPRTLNPLQVDPTNRLLWHMPMRRLEAEAVRDALLAVSGRLDSAMHGPSVLPYLTPFMEGRGRPQTGPLDGEGRRSIYINARRNFLTPLLLAFDYPVTFTPIGRRGTSAIPAQALTLMNDPLVVGEAARWAERARDEAGTGVESRIRWLYETAFARPPTADELAAAIDFLQNQSLRHGGSSDDPRVWADLCHVLINVKEFIFVP